MAFFATGAVENRGTEAEGGTADIWLRALREVQRILLNHTMRIGPHP